MKEKDFEYILFLCANICVSVRWPRWPRFTQRVIILLRDECEVADTVKGSIVLVHDWCVPEQRSTQAWEQENLGKSHSEAGSKTVQSHLHPFVLKFICKSVWKTNFHFYPLFSYDCIKD